MNEHLKQQLREALMEKFGLDIDEAVFRFSTQNYAFIFPEKPYMLRVSIRPKRSRAELLSELMWVDDLKQFKETICEPSPSLEGRLLEEFEIDGQLYRASMFRTARGKIKETVDMTPMFFICAGDLLGTIHHVSTDEEQLGMHYKRADASTAFAALIDRVGERMPADVLAKVREVQGRVDALPRETGKYGLCHGDFHSNNFFVEANNIWLFDFDGCIYTYYLYDVASFMLSCLTSGYGHGKDLKTVLYQEIMPYFQIGYKLNKECDDHYFDEIELFIQYRLALSIMGIMEIEKIGIDVDLGRVTAFYTAGLMADHVLEGLAVGY